MIPFAPNAPLAAAPLFLAAGLLAGLGHLALLRRNVALLLQPRGLAPAVLLQLLRFGLLGLVLLVLARHGAVALLAGALGVVAARHVVLRRVAEQVP